LQAESWGSISEWHNGIKSWLCAHHTGDVALASQVFGEEHISRIDLDNGTIPYLDFGVP
jgi:hypothetical protein